MTPIDEGYRNKLKNKLYSCLCDREADKEWEACLDSILIELLGWAEEDKGINYLVIWYKLSSCRYLSYKYFRKTIFDVMTLLSSNKKENNDGIL